MERNKTNVLFNKITIILLTLMLLSIPAAASTGDEITVTQSLSTTTASPGDTIDVTVQMTMNTPVTALTYQADAPDGWTVSWQKDYIAEFKSNTSEWIWSSEYPAGFTRSITYQLEIPESTFGGTYTITGAASGYEITPIATTGQTQLTVTGPTPPLPEADFEVNATSGIEPLTVQFNDLSTNTDTWAWDFNNDSIIDSTEQNPVYEFTNPGIYTVFLKANNSYGEDTETKEDLITVSRDTVEVYSGTVSLYPDERTALGALNGTGMEIGFADNGMVDSIGGYAADRDNESNYWHLYLNGAYSMTGVAETVVEHGDVVKLILASDDPVTWALNEWDVKATVTINVIDKISPVATLISITPNPAAEGEEVTFNGSGEDDDGAVVGYNWTSSIDGPLSTSDNFSTSDLSIGTHTIYFKVQNDIGHWSYEVQDTLEIIDDIAPVVTIDEVATPTNVNNIMITGTFVEKHLDQITVNGINATIGDGTYSANLTLEEGINTIEVIATDTTGNTDTETTQIVLDTIAPVIYSTFTHNSTHGMVDVTSSENIAELEVNVNPNPIVIVPNGDLMWTGSFLLDGENTFNVSVTGTDTAGNIGMSNYTAIIRTVEFVNGTVEFNNSTLGTSIVFNAANITSASIVVTESMEPMANLTDEYVGFHFINVELDSNLTENMENATIRIPIPEDFPETINKHDVSIRYYNETTSEWEPLDNETQVVVIGDKEFWVVEVSHFSIYAAIADVPEEPAEVPETPRHSSGGGSSSRASIISSITEITDTEEEVQAQDKEESTPSGDQTTSVESETTAPSVESETEDNEENARNVPMMDGVLGTCAIVVVGMYLRRRKD
ncbi:PKD domain-containing protein [Methanococcoides sp.]|uniref:PKD domain-containing protein n=1 Tax=Methanococcoides sp. TaxID=1966350 RepID=UPI00272EC38F|nr:PKD domain-containing protein [Methanococcoides sp.]